MSLLNDQNQIVRTAPPLASMDFAGLLQEGIDACQALSGATWTDYNEHDPGRTMLEQLCYAITDLGYRCDFPVADVLAEQPAALSEQYSTLFPGPRILTCNPLTVNDYRKLIIDQGLAARWPNFKNVWVQAVAAVSGQTGQYAVSIEVIDPSQDCTALIEEVHRAYLGHRNIGEALQAAPAVLSLCLVSVNATVEVTPDADPDAVAANLLFELQDTLVPCIQTISVSAAMQLGVPPEAIYDGPPLSVGMIPDSQLQPARVSVAQAELAGAMLAVSGVVAVNALQVQVGGVPLNGTAPVPSGQVARLQPSVFAPLTSLPFQLVCQDAPVNVNLARVQRLLAQRLAAAAPTAGLAVADPASTAYATLPLGQQRDIGAYFSLQRQFPAIYGLGAEGLALPQTTSEAEVAQRTARLAMAKQLKAYLLFFEQWLADAQTQLAQAGRLFSLDPLLDRSYFLHSLVCPDGPPEVVSVLRAGGVTPAPRPAPEPARYVLHVRDPEQADSLLLRSAEYAAPDLAEAAGRRILARGTDPAHYQVRQLPGQQHQLWLEEEDGQALAFGAERYASADDARVRVQTLAIMLTDLARSPEAAARALLVVERGNRMVRLLDTQGQVLLDGRQLSAAGQERWVRQLFQFGTRAACYRVQARPGERWRLALADLEGRVFARGDQDFATHEESARQIGVLTALIQRLCCDPAAQARQIQRLPRTPAAGTEGGTTAAADGRVRHYLDGWEQAVRHFDPFEQRRNRVLDHLLAHFCERFDDLALMRLDPRPAGDRSSIARDLIGWKLEFLKRYAVPHGTGIDPAEASTLGNWLGGARSRAESADYDSGPVSRLALLLGLSRQGGQPAAYTYVDPHADPDGACTQMAANASALRFTASQPAVLRALLDHGAEAANYQIVATDAGHELRFQWPGTDAPCTVYSAPDQAGAEQARQAAIDFLRSYPEQHLYAGEHLHAVDHGQLRTGDTADQAPAFYDHRVSLALPDWPLRFQDPAFRAFALQTAVDNFPGHIDVRLFWLNQPRMQAFADLHGKWQAARQQGASAGPDAHTALASFIAELDRAQDAQVE